MQPDDRRAPWYRTPWGIVWLSLVAIASATIVVTPLVLSRSEPARPLLLSCALTVLDVLLPIGIGLAVFRRRFCRLPGHKGVDLLVNLIIFSAATGVTWMVIWVVVLSLAWPA
jgi:hypothetical protein